MKKVLLITVTAGEGHNSVVKALKEELEDYSNTEVRVVDIYKDFGTESEVNFVDGGYKLACRKALGAFNTVFGALQNKNPKNRYGFVNQLNVNKYIGKILKYILEYKPDFILTSHVWGAMIINNIRLSYPLDIPTGAILTDFTIHPYWESAIGVDYLFTPNDAFTNKLVKKGFRREQIFPLGLPVKTKFSEELDKIETREKLGLDTTMYTVMMMTGGGGFGGMLNMFKKLNKISEPLQLVVVNGKDEKTKQTIDKYVKEGKSKHTIVNLGFINNVDEYMSASDIMIGKCGCISLCESMNKGLVLLTNHKLVKQELDNLNFLQDNNACLYTTNKRSVDMVLEDVVNRKIDLEEIRRNVQKLKRPNATRDICEFMMDLPSPDYDNLKYIDAFSEKEIKNRIKNAVKHEHRNRHR